MSISKTIQDEWQEIDRTLLDLSSPGIMIGSGARNIWYKLMGPNQFASRNDIDVACLKPLDPSTLDPIPGVDWFWRPDNVDYWRNKGRVALYFSLKPTVSLAPGLYFPDRTLLLRIQEIEAEREAELGSFMKEKPFGDFARFSSEPTRMSALLSTWFPRDIILGEKQLQVTPLSVEAIREAHQLLDKEYKPPSDTAIP